jgi:hypothetical protein
VFEIPSRTGAGEANRTPDPNLGNAWAAVLQKFTKFYPVSNLLTIKEIIASSQDARPYELLQVPLIIALLKLWAQFNKAGELR